MLIKIKYYIIAFVFGLIAGYLVATLLIKRKNENKEIEEVKTTKTDTAYVVLPKDTIFIEKGKAKIIYKYKTDTIIKLSNFDTLSTANPFPFTATLDTIIKNDTLNLKYYYPENYFWLLIKQSPDTLRTITIFKDKTIKVVEERPWYELPLYVIGGFLLGYTIAK